MLVSRVRRFQGCCRGARGWLTVVLEIDVDDLVALARSGDEAAFAAMVEPHRPHRHESDQTNNGTEETA
jgi:hypothetical protein